MRIIPISIVLLVLVSCANTSNILLVSHIPTGSHYILASRLATEIAKRGHAVTFITPYPKRSTLPPNVEEIAVEQLQHVLQADANFSPFDHEKSTNYEMAKFTLNFNFNLTNVLLGSPQMQNLMKSNRKYDAVVLYYYLNEALMPLGWYFKAPLILFKSMPLYASESFTLSHPNPSSYVPNIITGHTAHMTFMERFINTYNDVLMVLYQQWIILPKHRELVKKYIPGAPPLDTIVGTESVVLLNTHPSTNEPIALPPNAFEIGGYHIEPKKLPNDLETFLNGSSDGVILFSMGSIAQSSMFPLEKRAAILKVLGKLKEKVLWKFETDLPDLPANVKIMKWIPQSDILAHPNVKLFISHGGLLSTLESVYNGVPIIGIPLFVDQKMNMALAGHNGYAVEMPLKELNEESLASILREVLTNPRYKDNALGRARILKDRPMKPSDVALYWIEYSIRHKGAQHLRHAAKDLNWFQKHLIDVGAFVMVVLLFPVLLIAKVLCKKSRKVKKE